MTFPRPMSLREQAVRMVYLAAMRRDWETATTWAERCNLNDILPLIEQKDGSGILRAVDAILRQ